MLTFILRTCAMFSWFIETAFASVIFFGEYPYPTEEDAE